MLHSAAPKRPRLAQSRTKPLRSRTSALNRQLKARRTQPRHQQQRTAASASPLAKSAKKDAYKLVMRVPAKHHQTRMDQFLHHAFPTLTTKALSKMIKKKEITISKASAQRDTRSSPPETLVVSSHQGLREVLSLMGENSGDSQAQNALLIQPTLPPDLTAAHSTPAANSQSHLTTMEIPSFILAQHHFGWGAGSAPAVESSRVGAGDLVVVPPWLCHLHPDPSIQTIHKLLSNPELLGGTQVPVASEGPSGATKQQPHLSAAVLSPEQLQIHTLLRSIPLPAPLPSSFTELYSLIHPTKPAPPASPYLTPSFSALTRTATNSTRISSPGSVQRPQSTRHLQQLLTDAKKLQKMTLYSDPYLFCINKPSGIAVHASDFQTNTAAQRQQSVRRSMGLGGGDYDDEWDDGGANLPLSGSEHHIDSLLESTHLLAQHYSTFVQLTRQAQQSDSSEAPMVPVPYSLSEIQALARIAAEGHEYYSGIGALTFDSNTDSHHQGSASNTTPTPTRLEALSFSPTPSATASLPPLISLLSPDPPRLVHRLDKATSGVLTIAKSRLVAKTLSKMFHALSTQSPSALSETDSGPNDAEKLLHKVYLAITFTHPLAATEILAGAAQQANQLRPPRTSNQRQTRQIQPTGFATPTISLKQADLTFPNLFGFNSTPPLLPPKQPLLESLGYPSLSPLMMSNPANIKAVLTNPTFKPTGDSLPSLLSSSESKLLSFPTAPYISLSNTQQRIRPHQRKKPVSGLAHGDDGLTATKTSRSLFKILHKNPLCSLIAFSPTTGHFHQLRIQSAAKEGLQAPILGDDKYLNPGLLQTLVTANKPGVGILQGNDGLPNHLLRALDGVAARSGSNPVTLMDYYHQVESALASSRSQHHSSPINTSKLYLVSHSLSFPHPLVLSHSGQGKQSSNGFDLMPLDSTEFRLAQRWLQSTSHLFSSSSYSVSAPASQLGQENQQSNLDLALLTVTCELPNWFAAGLNSIGVKVL